MSARVGRKAVRVSVPATSANLGPGFDVLGLALGLRNEAEFRWEKGRGLEVEISGEGEDSLPRGEENLVVRSFRRLAPARAYPFALRVRLLNRIPLARGLGSSAAARLAGVLAAAAMTGKKADAVALASAMEGHPDNVVPAFHGGLCASRVEGGKVEHVRLSLAKGLTAVVCIPDFQVSTDRARAILPRKVPLSDAVLGSSRLAFLIDALENGRFERLGSAMEDRLHQPYRRALIPGMDRAIAAARAAGAYGAALSGSGPTILALAPAATAAAAGRAMRAAFARRSIRSRWAILKIDASGARVSASLGAPQPRLRHQT